MENDKEFSCGMISFSSSELLRIMMASLTDLGFSKSVQMLENESGITSTDSSWQAFCTSVLAGDWDASLQALKSISLVNSTEEDVVILIYILQYVELLMIGNVEEALKCLQQHIKPNAKDINILKGVSSCLICTSQDNLQFICRNNNIPGTRNELINRIRTYVSPYQIVPKHQLENMLCQSLMFQAITHGYNDTNPKEDDEFLQRKLIKAFTSDNNGTLPCHMSLLERQTIKSQIGEINSKSLFQSCLSICTISNAHENHILFVKLAPCGSLCATGDEKGYIKIWGLFEPGTWKGNKYSTIVFLANVANDLEENYSKLQGIQWTSDSNCLLANYSSTIFVYNINKVDLFENICGSDEAIHPRTVPIFTSLSDIIAISSSESTDSSSNISNEEMISDFIVICPIPIPDNSTKPNSSQSEEKASSTNIIHNTPASNNYIILCLTNINNLVVCDTNGAILLRYEYVSIDIPSPPTWTDSGLLVDAIFSSNLRLISQQWQWSEDEMTQNKTMDSKEDTTASVSQMLRIFSTAYRGDIGSYITVNELAKSSKSNEDKSANDIYDHSKQMVVRFVFTRGHHTLTLFNMKLNFNVNHNALDQPGASSHCTSITFECISEVKLDIKYTIMTLSEKCYYNASESAVGVANNNSDMDVFYIVTRGGGIIPVYVNKNEDNKFQIDTEAVYTGMKQSRYIPQVIALTGNKSQVPLNLLATCEDSCIYVWECKGASLGLIEGKTATPEHLETENVPFNVLRGHKGCVNALSIVSNSDRISMVSVSDDNSIKLWES